MSTIVEYLRQKAIERLFETNSFNNAWKVWKPIIHEKLMPSINNISVFNLGDHLREIFYSTNEGERSQSAVSAGGANWEALVCYYLNLCLIGRNTVVIKHNKNLIPEPIRDAMTVNYKNFISNTESDLIAITFPSKEEYIIDKEKINLSNLYKKNSYDLLGILNFLCARDFDDIEIHIIQCKTNWNDNAQIPMLWDMIYSSKGFNNQVKIGRNNYDLAAKVTATPHKKFTYSFVTVPTVNLEKIKTTSTSVQRVRNLSGGNYWGLESKSGVASSIKEMLTTNLDTGHTDSIRQTLTNELPHLSSKYSYFRL